MTKIPKLFWQLLWPGPFYCKRWKWKRNIYPRRRGRYRDFCSSFTSLQESLGFKNLPWWLVLTCYWANSSVVDENALHPEVEAYLGRGRPKSELRVNFNRGFEKMFEELSLQISKNLVTSEYAKVKLFEIEQNTSIKLN